MLSRDRYGIRKGERIAKVLISFIGIGYLFPYSALSNAIDYFSYIFKEVNILFLLSSIYMWSNLFVIASLVIFCSREINFTKRIVVGFVGQFLVLVIIPSSYYAHFSNQQNLVFVLLSTAIVSMFTSLIDSCAIAFVAQFPTQIQEAFQLGVGYSNLIGSMYRILTKLCFRFDQIILSSMIYFYFGALTIAICIVSYYYFIFLSYSQTYLDRNVDESSIEEMKSSDIETDETTPFILVTETSNKQYIETKTNSYDYEIAEGVNNNYDKSVINNSAKNTTYGEINNEINYIQNSNTLSLSPKLKNSFHSQFTDVAVETTDEKINRSLHSSWIENIFQIDKHKLKVWLKVWKLQLLVIIVFMQSLALWPSLITEISCYNFSNSINQYMNTTKWWALILLAFYAIFDVVGRYVLNYRGYITSNNIWFIVLLRFIYFPIMFGLIKGYGFWINDFFAVFIISSFGFSHGYIGSLCIIMSNEVVRKKDQMITGQFSGLSLILGTVIGSTVALALKRGI